MEAVLIVVTVVVVLIENVSVIGTVDDVEIVVTPVV